MADASMAAPQILIVGAGPTGLSLAITCHRFGIPVRLIDRAPQASQVSKALGVWSGSLEAFSAMGVIPALLAEGRRLHGVSAGPGGRVTVSIPVGRGIDSPYPFPLLLAQSRTERILGSRLAELGGTIERGVELLHLRQDAGGVTATLRRADGREEIVRPLTLVGCDGARSTVREALGIGFEGETEPGTFLLADARIEGGPIDAASIHLWWGRGGTVALFPFEDGIWRVVAERRNGGDGHAPKGDSLPASLAEIQAALDASGPGDLSLQDPGWLSTFRINERLAAQYRVGRCFLAGDAAHIHSPAGGQGMNTGVQDGINLGWKLAHAVRGVGEAELLLASYEAERRPVGRDVIKAAAQKLHIGFGNGPLPSFLRALIVPVLARLPAVQRHVQVDLSETEIVYRAGGLVALGAPPRRPRRTQVGARARDARFRDLETGETRRLWPLLGTPRHSLLVFGHAALPEGICTRSGTWLQILRLGESDFGEQGAAARYGMPGPGWVLVRPDQVVAVRSDGAGEAGLATYAAQVLEPAAVSEIPLARHAA